MKKNALVLALAAAFAPSLLFAGGPSPALSLERVLGGQLSEPVVGGGLMYLPNGRALTVIDAAEPMDPRIIADTSGQPTGGRIVGLTRAGRYLYAAWDTEGSDSGVAVYSLIDPLRPVLLGEIDYAGDSFANAHSIAAGEGHLYLFDSELGLFAADLAESPAEPAFTHALVGFGHRQRAYVQDGRLYAVGRSWISQTTLEAFDLATPMAPASIGLSIFDGNANFSFKLHAPLAFGYGYGFHVYDVADPANAIQLSTQDDGRVNFNGVTVGNFAYAIGNTDVAPWNIADPEHPVAADPVPMDSFATDVAVPFDEHAWLGTRADRMVWLDLANPDAPRPAGEALLPGTVEGFDIAFAGDKALILQNTYGFQIADAVTLLPQGRFVADLPPVLQQRAFEQIKVDGERAYLASWGYGLIVADISDPSQPVELGNFPAFSTSAVDAAGSFVYLGLTDAADGGVKILDVSDPSEPVLRGMVPGVQGVRVKAARGHLFVADLGFTGGLRVYDVRNPDAPVQVAHHDVGRGCQYAVAVALSSDTNTAYAVCNEGLHVLDVSSPDAPAPLGVYPFGGMTALGGLAVDGDRVYLSTDHGFDEVVVSDPANPVRAFRHPLPAVAREVRIGPDARVYLMTGSAGLHVFTRDSLFADGFEAGARGDAP